jgi:hypothetical protein
MDTRDETIDSGIILVSWEVLHPTALIAFAIQEMVSEKQSIQQDLQVSPKDMLTYTATNTIGACGGGQETKPKPRFVDFTCSYPEVLVLDVP